MTPWQFLIGFVNAAHKRINDEVGEEVLPGYDKATPAEQRLFAKRNRQAFDYLAKAELPSVFSEAEANAFRAVCKALAEAKPNG